MPDEIVPKQTGTKVAARELLIPKAAKNEFHKGIESLNQKERFQREHRPFSERNRSVPGLLRVLFRDGDGVHKDKTASRSTIGL